MAGMFSRFNHLMLFVFVCFCEASLNRRFSDFKRCADEECSMLLCRGKAAKDFSGPDCRFLSFKKGETVYVYYKLSGQRSDVWAGSVGSNFGYFPKDYLNINHVYTEKEFEVPAQETDFVCFDTGLDKFKSYDVDLLLKNSLLLNESESAGEKSEVTDHSKDGEVTDKDVEMSQEELPKDTIDADVEDSDVLLKESKQEELDKLEDVSDLEAAEPRQLPLDTSASAAKDKDSSTVRAMSDSETNSAKDAESSLKQTLTKDMPDEPLSKGEDTLDKSDHVSEVEALPELETTLGTTFDAVISEDKETQRVTPYFEENKSSELVDQPTDQADEVPKEPALLPAAEEHPYIEESPTESKEEATPPEHAVEEQEDATEASKDGNMWSSLGDTVFKIVSGGERTVIPEDTEGDHDDDDEEEDDDDEEEEEEVEVINIEESEKYLDQLNVQSSEMNKEADKTTHSNDNSVTVDPISSTDDETEQPNNDFKDDEPTSSADTKASETKHSSEDSETEDPISLSDTKYNEESEHDSKILKYENEMEELESTEKADLSERSLDVEETDAVVESEHDTPASYLKDDKPVENIAEKTAQKASTDEDVQQSEDLSEENAALLDEKKDEQNDEQELEDMVKEQHKHASEDDDDDDDNENDEQIESIKNDLVHESTLKAEQDKTDSEEEPETYDENEEIEELLEDENALLSAKTELSDKAEEVDESIENIKPEPELDLAEDEEQKENLLQTDEETVSNTVSSLDSSVSPQDKENDIKSIDGDGADEIQQDAVTSKEPQYSDSVLRLALLRDHFKDDEMKRIQKYLDLKDLFRIEAMFTELEQELKSVRESGSETSDDIEKTLESILEVSENSILDEIEKMLDTREQKVRDLGQQMDPVMFDEEAAILDDFQEFAFYLRQKYSAVSDSIPLVEDSQSNFEMENLNTSEKVEDLDNKIPVTEAAEALEVQEEVDKLSNVNVEERESRTQDMGLGEDGGHFNKNKDIQASFKETEEVQRGPQAILENPLDIAFGFEVDASSGSLESQSASDLYDNKANYEQASTSTSDHVWDWLVLGSEFLGMYSEILIAALPEEWQPGPTFHGLPWKPVVATAIVGIITILMFIWKTVLAVKSKTYILTEKQLSERIQQLVTEKSDILHKITELNNMIKQYEEKLKNSEKSRSSIEQEFEGLKARYQELHSQREDMSVNISQLGQKIAGTQEENTILNEKVVIMQQRIEKHQKTLKQYEDERLKIQVLMDEAKLREDALKAQVLSFEKDNSALKEQKKSLLCDAKDWQVKHGKLSEEIKVYHKKQKDLEDSLVHKENEIDVLSSCIAELKSLDICDGTELQKGDTKLAIGAAAEKKGDPIKLRLKQMMDVSRIKATLSVIEDERNRYLENFLAEQKARQELEEQFQKVVHDQTNLKNEKTHLESQFKNLEQRLEITTELYQQKENALQQKLTQEELERREKETKLTEVDGRAVQAEEELNSLRHKVKDMQEEMQQNERALKAEIAVQEKKAHENWLKARASERALIEERRESANLRQKIVECSDKMSDLEHALYKSGPSERNMAPLRRGDSYGPSPVSGGAPSPPLMIEGPGRPPSAPVGRRNEPFGPRPPSDPHGRFSDLGHPLPSRPELFAPRTSSPCTQDGSFQLSKSQSQGSFLPSPIRDSPGPISSVPPKAYVPQSMGGPPPSNGPLSSMIRPPNGHPPMIPPGPPLGPDLRFRPPHMDSYGPPPLRPFGPVPPPFVRGPPLRDLPPMGPPPPPFARDFPPDFAGPRNLPFPPRPFPHGSLPPPGTMGQPPFIARDLRGPTPPVPQSFRDGEMGTGHATDGQPQQGAAHDSPASAMAEP